MLDTHSLLLSFHSSPPQNTSSCSLLHSRTALADSTNANSHTNACAPGYSKGLAYPTSHTRTTCGWNDSDSGSTSTLLQSRHHHFSSTSSPFPVTYKAPPTVSISLSAACSQSILGERPCGSRAQGLESDLPDVKSVVPFPITTLDSDIDVDMLDGTCSNTRPPSTGRAPRKRHSAQSSVSSSLGNPGKDVKLKRQRKSKRQVAELCWLGVVHRSILHGIETRQSYWKLDASHTLPSGLHDLDAMDRLLAGKIQKRLADNGCVEGQAPPNPLPRISLPRMSGPSLNLVAPSRKTVSTGPASSSDRNPRGSDILDEIIASPPASKPHLDILPSPTSHSRLLTLADTFTPQGRRIHSEPRQLPLYPSIPRRSPSPPPRTGAVSTNAQTLTLTIPHLVASLVLAHHERSGLRLRGRNIRVAESGKDAGGSAFSAPPDRLQRSNADTTCEDEKPHSASVLRARLMHAPGRRSPLSRVLYTES